MWQFWIEFIKMFLYTLQLENNNKKIHYYKNMKLIYFDINFHFLMLILGEK